MSEDRFQPSAFQREELLSLGRREVCLQYQVRYGDGGQAERVQEALRSTLPQASGTILSASRVQQRLIGEGAEDWDEFWLIRFPSPEHGVGHVTGALFRRALDGIAEFQVQLATPPSSRQRLLLGAAHSLLRLLPMAGHEADIGAEQMSGGINPSPAQYQEFAAGIPSPRVHMFNLLRFHERARYSDGDHGRTGAQAYARGYGPVALAHIARLGGKPIFLGRYRATILGAGGDPCSGAWDELAVVEYPGRQAFARMLRSPSYQKALEHRRAGLASTCLWAAAPHEA